MKSKHPSLPVEALLVSGGTAGMISRLATGPIDRIKILYIVDAGRPFTFRRGLKTLRTIYYNTGVMGLWRFDDQHLSQSTLFTLFSL